MIYIDLFAGIGGFAYGAWLADMKFEKHYFSEVEPFAVELYQKRFPDAIPLGDITKIKTEDLPNGEYIITGGFPCQDISIAGKGAGVTGARSGLWFEYWRLIRDLRPRFAIMENVGMLVHRGLREVLGSLAEIGYNAEWQDIRAEDMGAPHKRERIWIITYPGNVRKDKHKSRIQQERSEFIRTYVDSVGAEIPNTDSTRPPGNGRTNATVKNSNGTENGISQQDCEKSRGHALSDTENARIMRWERSQKNVDRQVRGRRWDKNFQRWTIEPSVGRLVNGLPTVLDGIIRRLYEDEYNKETVAKIDRYYKYVLFGMWEKRKLAKTSYGGKSGFSYCLVSEMPYEITYEEWYMGTWIEKDKELCNMWGSLHTKSQQETQDLLEKMSIRIRANQCEQKMAENRVNRLKGLGNAIVPQIAELLFRQIKAHT